ncbi:predicted protein [Thalassiosira pseudonana CCMP1335]|uniref:Uncharacterized protein n=1 Tax=Thalassiosira pseudonana TaxID=35128 RepID=B8C155_THAPS|nr:predicted protein [Thalassiosira pseudonana CCMP1335]EED92720.1 predicted protein [Thalassiosira pseudonana CCMP1335]
MLKNNCSPIKKISHAGAKLAHRGSQIIDQASLAVQNGAKLSNAVVASAKSSPVTHRSRYNSNVVDNDVVGSMDNVNHRRPRGGGIRDRINKFDSVAASHRGGYYGSRQHQQQQTKTLSDQSMTSPLRSSVVVPRRLVARREPEDMPAFNPSYREPKSEQDSTGKEVEKENELPPDQHQQPHSSPHAKSVAKNDTEVVSSPQHKPPKSHRKQMKQKLQETLSPVLNNMLRSDNNNNSSNNNNNGEAEQLKKRLQQLEKENDKLERRNARLENKCDKLKRYNVTLEETVVSNDQVNMCSNSTKEEAATKNDNKAKTKKRLSNEHPLIASPLRKHLKAVHAASESNSAVTVVKEPFALYPPEHLPLRDHVSDVQKGGYLGSDDCHLDTLGSLTGNRDGEERRRRSSNVDQDGIEKEQEEAMYLLNSAAFLFQKSSRRNLG